MHHYVKTLTAPFSRLAPNMLPYIWNNRRCSESSIIPGIIGPSPGIRMHGPHIV